MQNLTGHDKEFQFYPKQDGKHCTDVKQATTALICHLNFKISLAAVWKKNLTTQKQKWMEGSKIN